MFTHEHFAISQKPAIRLVSLNSSETSILNPEEPNIVAHEYFPVDTRRIWETSIKDLPSVIEPLRNLLNQQ